MGLWCDLPRVKYSDDLRPIPDGTDGSRSSDSGTGTTSASRANGGRSSRNASDGRTVGTIGDDTVGGIGGSDDDGNGNAPGGSGRAARDNDPYRARPRRAGKSARPSGSHTRDANTTTSAGKPAATKEEKASAPSAVPREVDFAAIGKGLKPTASDSVLTKEFLVEGWSLLYKGTGFVLRDPEWDVQNDDAETLADRTLTWIGSLDKKRSAAFVKFMGKHQPLVSVIMAVLLITWPRIQHTMGLRRVAKNNLPPQGRTTAGSPTPSAPVSGPSAAMDFQAGGARPNGARPVVAHERPLRREDWREIYPADDTEPM